MTSHEPQASRPLALIADVYADTREMYAFLRAEGLSVEEARDGEEAFRRASDLHPDVIAVDLYLTSQPGLVRLLGVSEDAVQGVRVGAFNAAKGVLQRLTNVGCHRPNVAPMTTVWDLESIVLGKERVLFVAV